MRFLKLLDRRAPCSANAARRWLIEHAVPFHRTLGVEVVRLAADSSEVVLRLRARRGNLNVAGTVHGGAILGFAETVHGAVVLLQFPPAQHRMVTRHATIRYLAPARGELRVSFAIPAETRLRIESELSATGRSEPTLQSSVFDESGKVVAELLATYVIRRITSDQAGAKA